MHIFVRLEDIGVNTKCPKSLFSSLNQNHDNLMIHPFVKHYDAASKNFSLNQCEKALSIVFESDLKIKGINSSGYNHFDLLEEILVKNYEFIIKF